MKRILFILLVTIPFIGFGQTEYVKKYYENGQLKLEGKYIDGKKEGLWKQYYENGQLSREENYKENKLDGQSKYYYINGKIMEERNCKKGERDGLFKRYYENGQLEHIWEFKDGLSNGYTLFFDENGQIRCIGRYIVNKKEFFAESQEGLWRWYYKNGQLKNEKMFKDRKIIYENCWDEKGNEIKCE